MNDEVRQEEPRPGIDAGPLLALSAASREKADAFLDEQTRLARLQAEDLRREDSVRHWSLRVRHISDVMRLAFELAAAAVFTAIAFFIGGAVWDAAHDQGLVVEAFSVPPDLAQRGLTGEVVAGRVLEKLAAMQAQTDTLRAPGSYANNWGNDFKVQIPDTGVSIGEFNRYLHQWLGHETRITGDVVRTGSSLTVSAHAGADAGTSFSGPDSELDRLLQRAAEAVYARTQPYRYGVFLGEHDKIEQALAIFAQIAQSGPSRERAWGDVGLGNMLGYENRISEAERAAEAGVRLEPDFALGMYRLGGLAATLGHEQMSFETDQKTLRLLATSAGSDVDPKMAPMMRPPTAGAMDDNLGDYADEAKQNIALRAQSDVLRVVLENTFYNEASDLAEDHDLAGARRVVAEAPGLTVASTNGRNGAIIGEVTAQNINAVELAGAMAQRNWPEVLKIARRTEALERRLDSASTANLYRPTQIWPFLALAEAQTGDFSAAHALIARTPLDCGPCVRARGNIRAAERKWTAAAFWFADAERLGPSIPFANADWGEMLLAKGDFDGAIGKFREANLKGPHFADPLEMWGEALMAKNRSDLALAKFEEANKYAPNWGRLHLEWGEALLWSGNKKEAAKQFVIALHLDLSQNDRAQLAGFRHV